jgi:hypothetical protein
MARGFESDMLVADSIAGFSGEQITNPAGANYVMAPLSHENAVILRGLFPFAGPAPVLRNRRSFGVGDRLGIATPGHIRAFQRYDAFPVLSQQSMREVNLTNRSFEDVLDCATFAVFRENFTRGFGADGDHLKTPEEIKYALSCGYSMITLDCSEHIRNDIVSMADTQINDAYTPNKKLEEKYLNRRIQLENGLSLIFDETNFKRIALIYGAAIEFAGQIYDALIKDRPDVDFEISIDETITPTSPAQHYFVAEELRSRGIAFATLAPRFCGEFQKGIDYIGDVGQFRREFKEHAIIAKHFGYKISVHSGSDKFKVFPIIGELTDGCFHVKTSGTSWLEAMRLVAMRDASLYREIHRFALTAFERCKQYYHVTANLNKIPDVKNMPDSELHTLFSQDDSRQLIHITYGPILREHEGDGSRAFRDRLYSFWRENDEAYAGLLGAHIGQHLERLYEAFAGAR